MLTPAPGERSTRPLPDSGRLPTGLPPSLRTLLVLPWNRLSVSLVAPESTPALPIWRRGQHISDLYVSWQTLDDEELTPAWGIGKAMVAAMSDEKRIANCMLRVIISFKKSV
jgi:hypothetical protein